MCVSVELDSRARLENSILGIPKLHLLSPSLRGYARAHVYAPLRLPCTRVGTHTLARGTALDRIYRLYLRRYALEENLSSSASSLFLFLASLFFYVSIFPSFLSVLPIHRFLLSPPLCSSLPASVSEIHERFSTLRGW